MKINRSEARRVKKFALLGAGSLGLIGFAAGTFLCLHYALPIPPLFLTEMGLLVGGCLGALCALTKNEHRVVPTIVALLLAGLSCLGVGAAAPHSVLALLATGLAAWTMADRSQAESTEWKSLT